MILVSRSITASSPALPQRQGATTDRTYMTVDDWPHQIAWGACGFGVVSSAPRPSWHSSLTAGCGLRPEPRERARPRCGTCAATFAGQERRSSPGLAL